MQGQTLIVQIFERLGFPFPYSWPRSEAVMIKRSPLKVAPMLNYFATTFCFGMMGVLDCHDVY